MHVLSRFKFFSDKQHSANFEKHVTSCYCENPLNIIRESFDQEIRNFLTFPSHINFPLDYSLTR